MTITVIIIKINNGAQRHVEYLVLWKRYPKEEASWVLDTDVTAPDFCIIFQHVFRVIH